MPLINDFRYRPEIDGLRALAVVSVVLFHAKLGLPGGFVGVDVFFVISGFLITALIWKDLENGNFTLASFWERRARRIAPALIVIALATIVAGWFILLPEDYRDLGKAARAQALGLANFHYHSCNEDYFAAATDEMPLLHTWSLALEEQFYVLMPLGLALLYRSSKLRSRSVVLSVLALGCACSLGLSGYAVSYGSHQTFSPSAAFYLLPGRAWELLLGSLLALAPTIPFFPRQRWPREMISLIGLSMIFYSLLTYDSYTRFPGLAALPPCLGTALFLWVNCKTAGDASTRSSRMFAWRPLVFLGAISYSLYLWHWPLLAFGNYLNMGEATLATRMALVMIAGVLAVFSWRFVEQPFRNRTLGTTSRSMYAYAGGGILLVLVAGLACRHGNGFPERVAPAQRKFVEARYDMAFLNELSTEDVRQGRLVPFGLDESTARPVLLVWGDSHAMAALPAFDSLLKEQGLSGVAATHSATPPIMNWIPTSAQTGLGKDTIAFNDAVFEYVRQRRIPDVILVARWQMYLPDDENASAEQGPGRLALLKTIEKLVAAGTRPWVMLEVPEQDFDIPRKFSRPVSADTDIDALCATPRLPSRQSMNGRDFVNAIRTIGGRVIDPKPAFLNRTGERYLFQSAGIVLYRDHHHLTVKGANQILLPVFRNSLPLAVNLKTKSEVSLASWTTDVSNRPPQPTSEIGRTRR